PGLRDRIDLAFLAAGGSQRRAVVEIRAAIPVAVPRVLVERDLERGRTLSPRDGTPLVAPTFRHPREFTKRRMQKPPEPEASTATQPADPVQAVIPVAR